MTYIVLFTIVLLIVLLGVFLSIENSKKKAKLLKKQLFSERQNQAIQETHNKRKGRINEVVHFIDYLAHQAPDHLTGSILPINGGQYT